MELNNWGTDLQALEFYTVEKVQDLYFNILLGEYKDVGDAERVYMTTDLKDMYSAISDRYGEHWLVAKLLRNMDDYADEIGNLYETDLDELIAEIKAGEVPAC